MIDASTHYQFLTNTRTIILGVTNDCNISCTYCCQDARFIPPGKMAKLLPAEVARVAIEDIIRIASSPWITIIFEGGEPTLAPIEWYKQVIIPTSRLALKLSKSLKFYMQSNGLLIDDSWASFFETYGIKVGLSIDGPPELSLPFRPVNENLAQTIQTLQAHGLRTGAIVVATPRNLPSMPDVISYLADLNIDGFHLLPLTNSGRFKGSSKVTSQKMILDGYIQIAETLLAHPDYPAEARLALYVSRYVGKPSIAINAIGCQSIMKPCGKQLIYLDEKGDIYPCQSLHSESYKFGHATEKGIEICSKPDLPEAGSLAANQNRIRCALCAANKICTFGCTADDIYGVGQWRCELAQGLYDYFRENSNSARKLYNILFGSQKNRQKVTINEEYYG